MKHRRVIAVLSGSEEDTPLLSRSYAICADYEARLDALFVRRNAASGGDFLGDAFSTYGMEAVLEALDPGLIVFDIDVTARFDTPVLLFASDGLDLSETRGAGH